jgi:hypothetical protein
LKKWNRQHWLKNMVRKQSMKELLLTIRVGINSKNNRNMILLFVSVLSSQYSTSERAVNQSIIVVEWRAHVIPLTRLLSFPLVFFWIEHSFFSFIHPIRFFFFFSIYWFLDDLKIDNMNLSDIIKFCINYPALVIAVIVGIALWSMVITVALSGGRNNAAKRD